MSAAGMKFEDIPGGTSFADALGIILGKMGATNTYRLPLSVTNDNGDQIELELRLKRITLPDGTRLTP